MRASHKVTSKDDMAAKNSVKREGGEKNGFNSTDLSHQKDSVIKSDQMKQMFSLGN